MNIMQLSANKDVYWAVFVLSRMYWLMLGLSILHGSVLIMYSFSVRLDFGPKPKGHKPKKVVVI